MSTWRRRGTASRARERPLTENSWGPQPLRSSTHPWGLPHLRHNDAFRVEQANLIYSKMATFCLFLQQLGIHWSVENPRHSYLWELGPFIELQQFARVFDFDACMHGSDRDKKTSFLATLGLSPLSVFWDGSHVHREWGLLEDNSFATAQEAEYPALLCKRFVQTVIEKLSEFTSFS